MADLVMTSVLRKTEAGINAIKVRDRAMAQKHRTLLILVDGAKTVAMLVKSLNDPDEALQVLGELVDSGFVDIAKAPTATTVSTPVPAMAPAPPTPTSGLSEKDLADSIRRATRLLENLLGPGSEPFCLQIEKCKSIDQFTARILDVRRVVAGMRSEAKADEFVAAALKS
jgi:hypothetical protein